MIQIQEGYPKGVATDLNPGPSKSYFFYGLNLNTGCKLKKAVSQKWSSFFYNILQ
jgi:hypothetical protein